jgi:hypothetical protein
MAPDPNGTALHFAAGEIPGVSLDCNFAAGHLRAQVPAD